MASNLTEEQKSRIEHNRKLALEKRAARLSQISNSPRKSSTTCESVSYSSLNEKQIGLVGTKSIENLPCRPISNQFSGSYSGCKPMNICSPSIVRAFPATETSTATSDQKLSKLFHQNSSESPKKTNPSYAPLNLNFLKSKDCEQSSSSHKDSPNLNSNNTTPNVSHVLIKSHSAIYGECRLISKDRFTVVIPYQQQILDLFKTIKGREYDSKTRLWTFPVTEYFKLRKAITQMKPHVIVGNLPKCIVETFITKARAFHQDISKVDISRIDEKLRETIYPFQKEGIQFGISKGGRCLIADDMGLGKSIQALGIADYFRSDWPLLIVCPSSMRFQWEEEIRVNLPNSVYPHHVFVMTSAKDIIDGAEVLILSYDLLVKKRDLIQEMKFGVVIMDESHNIKNSKTMRGKVALEVAKQCKRVILLSGTPALSRPLELFNQIQAVNPSIFTYFKEYGVRYCEGTETTFGWNFNGSSNMEELRMLLEARIMIRRLKSNVLTQLPSKIRQVIALNSQSLSKSNESMDAFALKLQSDTLKGIERHGTLLSYFAETAKTKRTAVCEYITDLLQENKKFLCFAHHAEMLNAVCTTLEKSETYYIRIDGSVSAEDRKALCEKFQFEEKWMVAVLSIKAANTGLTLTAAHVVIFAELFWNPGDLIQAEDRVHRIGQEDCVIVKYLIAKGTADDYLWPLIQTKLEVLNQAGLTKDSYAMSDIKSLEGPGNTLKTQTKMDHFVQNVFCNEDNMISDDVLLKAMDEIEGVQQKKIKLDV